MAQYNCNPFGPGFYESVGAKILQSGLFVPTGDLTAPLVREIYAGNLANEPELQQDINFLQDLQDRGLWVFQNNLWVNEGSLEGLFSVKDRKAKGLSELLTVEDLKKRLVGGTTHKSGVEFSKDREVAFAPRGSYYFGEMDAQDIENDGKVIAEYGPEGAKLMAEVASKLPNKSRNWGLEISEGQISMQRVSALSFEVHINFGRLHLRGDCCGQETYRISFSSLGDK